MEIIILAPSQVVNGTSYHTETPRAVIDVLEAARQNRTKLRVYYGDAATGKDWGEENDTIGRVGRSTGTVKIPLLVAPGEDGGGALLDRCIVRIREANAGGKELYRHHNYKQCVYRIVNSDKRPEYLYNVLRDEQVYSRHKTYPEAEKLLFYFTR